MEPAFSLAAIHGLLPGGKEHEAEGRAKPDGERGGVDDKTNRRAVDNPVISGFHVYLRRDWMNTPRVH